MTAKKLLGALALMLLTTMSATVATAAPKDGGKGGAGQPNVMRPIDVLSQAADKAQLSDEVKTKVHEIITDAQGKAQVIIDEAKAAAGSGKPDRAAVRQKMQELAKTTKESIVALLTPEQRTAFEQALTELRGKARVKGGEKPAQGEKPKQ